MHSLLVGQDAEQIQDVFRHVWEEARKRRHLLLTRDVGLVEVLPDQRALEQFLDVAEVCKPLVRVAILTSYIESCLRIAPCSRRGPHRRISFKLSSDVSITR